MAEYLSPGVYVEEYDNSPRAIEGVGTSTAGFVGLAEKGQVYGAPLLVTGYSDFLKKFGKPLNEFDFGEYRYLAGSVEQFFANGGTRCYVARVISPDAARASLQKGILKAEAIDEGKWGDKIRITLSSVTKRKMQVMKRSGDSYTVKSADGFREGDLVFAGKEYNRIKNIFENTVTFENAFEQEIVDPAIVPSVYVYLVETEMSVQYEGETEYYPHLSFNTASPDYIGHRLSASELVRISAEELTELKNPVEAVLGEGIREGTFNLEGGSDGSVSKVNAGAFIGVDEGPGRRTGICSFAENTNVNMMAVPGITVPEVVAALISHCENQKNRFAVIDMPAEMYKTKDLLKYRDMVDSTYAAMYHPWIQVFDRSSQKPGFLPPSGAVMGVYARTDINRGVHKAPANETVSCTGLRVNYVKAEQDVLNPAGINLIRALPGQGIRIWGARTAGSNSAFKYVNVRRLFLFVEESIRANTNWVVFEPNDASLWQRVHLTIAGFLENMWRNGMLAGGSASEAYFVEIGLSTMSRDDIMNGRLICNIGIAPSRPAEFVIFRVTQHTAEAAKG